MVQASQLVPDGQPGNLRDFSYKQCLGPQCLTFDPSRFEFIPLTSEIISECGITINVKVNADVSYVQILDQLGNTIFVEILANTGVGLPGIEPTEQRLLGTTPKFTIHHGSGLPKTTCNVFIRPPIASIEINRYFPSRHTSNEKGMYLIHEPTYSRVVLVIKKITWRYDANILNINITTLIECFYDGSHDEQLVCDTWLYLDRNS